MSRARRTAGASSLTLSNPSEESLVPLFKQWNETELRIFFEGLVLYGKDWTRIAQTLHGRSESEVEQLYLRSQNVLDCLLAQQAELQKTTTTTTMTTASSSRRSVETGSLLLPDLSLWFASVRDHDTLLLRHLTQTSSSSNPSKHFIKESNRPGHSKSDDDSMEYSLRRHNPTSESHTKIKSLVGTRPKRKTHRKLFSESFIDSSHSVSTPPVTGIRRSARVREKSLWNARDDEQIGAHELLALSRSSEVMMTIPTVSESETKTIGIPDSETSPKTTHTSRTPRKRKYSTTNVNEDEESETEDTNEMNYVDSEDEEATLLQCVDIPHSEAFPCTPMPTSTSTSGSVHSSVASTTRSSKEKSAAGRNKNVSASTGSRTRTVHSTPETRAQLLQRLTTALNQPLLRRWCFYEWFYSNIDAEWYLTNDFQQCLDVLGLRQVQHLRRAEWQYIRSLLGRPRRLSAAFLAQERQHLQEYRIQKRAQWRAPPQPVVNEPYTHSSNSGTELHPFENTKTTDDKKLERGSSDESDEAESIMNTLTTRYNRERQQSHQHFSLPLNTHLHEVIPSPFIPPHTIVLAVHPLPPHDVHRGTVITARSDSYEVRFHDPTLGTHWVPDLAVMSCGGSENVTVPIENYRTGCPPLSEIQTQPVPKTRRLFREVAPESSEDPSMKFNDTTLYFIANLFRLLERKELLLKGLQALNNEAETMKTYPKDFQQHYAWLILKLEETNRELGPALAEVRTLSTLGHELVIHETPTESGLVTTVTSLPTPNPLSSQLTFEVSSPSLPPRSPSQQPTSQSPSSLITLPLLSLPSSSASTPLSKKSSSLNTLPIPHHNWYSEIRISLSTILKQCKSFAQVLVARVLRTESAESVGTSSDDISSAPITSGLSIKSQLESIHPVQTSSSRLSSRVIQYLTACIALLLHIQTCAEYQMKPSEVALAFNAALTSIRPRMQNPYSLRLFKEIEASLTIIRNKLTASDSA